jgi:hypothetical protein
MGGPSTAIIETGFEIVEFPCLSHLALTLNLFSGFKIVDFKLGSGYRGRMYVKFRVSV